MSILFFFFFQAEDGIRDGRVTGVQTCALPIWQKLPESFSKNLITAMGEVDSPLLADRREWKQHGQSGIWVSDWLPHIAGCVDDLAVIRSCWGDGLNHANGVGQMNTGSILGGRPSMGSWVSYGLGTENQNLPAFT